jgi:putative FmdB family regulatory protein
MGIGLSCVVCYILGDFFRRANSESWSARQSSISRWEVIALPIFEYECQECGQVFEVLVHRFGLTPVTACPRCSKTNVERLWSTFATQASSRGGCGSAVDGIG